MTNIKYAKVLVIPLIIIVVIITVFANAFSESNNEQNTYRLNDSIPYSAQKKAIKYLLSDEASVIGKKITYNNGYGKILEKYLNYYGIKIDSNNISTSEWIQNELIKYNKLIYIPEELVNEADLAKWVEENASPGDLLLYKANGKADRCIIYAGNGKGIIKRDEEFKLLPFPATFVSNDQIRTKSSGLYAISHIWKEENNSNKFIELDITLNTIAATFTGDHYDLMIYDDTTGEYSKSDDYIVFEKEPGVFTVWNGTAFGFNYDYVINHNGIHIMLVKATITGINIPPKIKIDINKENIKSEESVIDIKIDNNRQYEKIWNGKDLLYILGGKDEEQ